MRAIKNFFERIIICVWIIVAILVTIYLISYNEYHISVMGNTSIVIMDNDVLEPKFKEGSLLLIKRTSNEKINIGDNIFVIRKGFNRYEVKLGEVTDKEQVTESETTFEINKERKISSEYVLGTENNTKSIDKVGYALLIFSSKWGYMFLVILPTLFALIYEIMMIVEELKNDDDDDEEEVKKTKKKSKK